MSENEDWWTRDDKPSLRMWIFLKMTYGAAMAGLVLFLIFFVILFFKALSNVLPEDPNAALELGTQMIRALA